MLIKMLCGTFGAIEDGIIVVKTNKSGPFCVEEKRGRELIEAGYAQEVKDTCYPEDITGVKGAVEDKTSVDDYSLQELRNMAKEMGLPAGGGKTEIFDRIEMARKKKETVPEDEDIEEADEGAEESPLLKAAEPEA